MLTLGTPFLKCTYFIFVNYQKKKKIKLNLNSTHKIDTLPFK
jgi:hypothetical protein